MSATIDVDRETLAKLQPSEALTRLLQKAQADHRDCVKGALAKGEDVVEKCNLTWGEVYHRYRQWSQYRAPFSTEEAQQSWSAHWTQKRQEKADKSPFASS
jgi:hypothetical protein